MTRTIKVTAPALVGAALLVAVGLTMSIDWAAYLTAVTGSLGDILALAAGVVTTVISAALIVKGVRWVARSVTAFMGR